MKKTEKVLIVILTFIMFIQSIINYKVDGYISTMIFIVGFILYLLPLIVNLIFKFKLTTTIRYIYYLFIFISFYIGIMLNGYMWDKYNLIVSFTFGILTSFLGLIITELSKKNPLKKIFSSIVIILFTTILISSFTQLLEYFVINKSVQIIFIELLVTLSGSLVFVLWYLYEIILKSKMFITKFIKEIRDYYE